MKIRYSNQYIHSNLVNGSPESAISLARLAAPEKQPKRSTEFSSESNHPFHHFPIEGNYCIYNMQNIIKFIMIQN